MAFDRVFLGWDAAVLPSAAAWLIDRYGVDLSGLVLGVPTRRAGRRLLELLVEASETAAADPAGGGGGGGGGVVPPLVQTPGNLPECLYESTEAAAGEWSAWSARAVALRAADAAVLAEVVPHPPTAGDTAGWMRLAEQLGQLSVELAAGGLTPADVAERGRRGEVDLGLGLPRWEALAELERRYRETLGRDDREHARRRALAEGACRLDRPLVLVGLVDLSPQLSAMLDRVAANTPVTALVPAPEAHAGGFDRRGGLIVNYWLDQPVGPGPEQPRGESNAGNPAQGHAEPAATSSGDAWGDASPTFCDRPEDQALAVVRSLAGLPVSTAAEQVSVGLGDESGAAMLARTIELAGTPARVAAGASLRQSGPVVLLETVARFIQTRGLSELAAVIRHPDLAERLGRPPAKRVAGEFTEHVLNDSSNHAEPGTNQDRNDGVGGVGGVGGEGGEGGVGWLSRVDGFATEFLQVRVGREAGAENPGGGKAVNANADANPGTAGSADQHLDSATWAADAGERGAIAELARRVEALLPGVPSEGEAQADAESDTESEPGGRAAWDRPLPWPAWVPTMAGLLEKVYGGRRLRRGQDQPRIDQLEAIGRGLREIANLELPGSQLPRVDFATAVSLLIGRLSTERTPEVGGNAAVELVGFLEMPWDDARFAVLTDLNEGHVPAGRMGDAFLPDGLRGALGLADGRRRLARDGLLMNVVLRSRGWARVLACRESSAGDPRVPSRLLLKTDRTTRAARLRAFYPRDEERSSAEPAPPLVTPGGRSGFLIPPPALTAPALEGLRVTGFRDYLACRYRFYLVHVEKLKSLDDRADELSGAAYGTLAHAVLQDFGKSPAADCDDAERIEGWLSERLDLTARRRFGGSPRPAVRVQVEQLQERLGHFARRQAALVAEGWRIRPDLVEQKFERQVVVDGQPFTITGQIDRVDEHPERGLRLLDYKTSEKGPDPDQTHRRRGQWVDLQLPLYLTLMGRSAGGAELGYFNLPKDPARVGVAVAAWSGAELAEAQGVRDAVIRGVRAGRFWPPSEEAPRYRDAFTRLAADGALGRDELIRRSAAEAGGAAGGALLARAPHDAADGSLPEGDR